MRAKLLRRAKSEQEINFQGIPITIENPKGSTREGTGKDGKAWSREMHADYGFVTDTVASGDKEDLDVYVGSNPDAPNVYVVEQLTDDGDFDEYKCVLGVDSEAEARELYLKHYPDDWEEHIGSISTFSVQELADMVAEQTGTEPEESATVKKTGRFLTIDEVKTAFREHVLPRPEYQQAFQELGGGQAWEELDQATKNAVAIRGFELEHPS